MFDQFCNIHERQVNNTDNSQGLKKLLWTQNLMFAPMIDDVMTGIETEENLIIQGR